MALATLTSKGQLTLPKPIRERLGVRAGDRVVFRETADGVVVVEPDTVDLRSLRGALKPRRTGVTLDDMERAIAEGASKL